MYRHFFKRFLDFCISLLVLLIISPLLLVVIIWLYFANKGGGAFFLQERVGKDKKIFRVIKFKSMTDERDKDGKLLSDTQRLTTAGRFIRSTSIDELPQLVNVLKGDMSLIGPRPLVAVYLPYYNETEQLRHSIRPGITGLAQVNGRNAISWEERFSYDIEYVDHLNFWLDLRIMFKTIQKVIRQVDIGVRGIDLIDFDKYRQQQLNSKNHEYKR